MKTIYPLVENNTIRKMMSIRLIFPDIGKYLNPLRNEKIKTVSKMRQSLKQKVLQS